jgi:hypothetical protein
VLSGVVPGQLELSAVWGKEGRKDPTSFLWSSC